jgi:hypothetical protein
MKFKVVALLVYSLCLQAFAQEGQAQMNLPRVKLAVGMHQIDAQEHAGPRGDDFYL